MSSENNNLKTETQKPEPEKIKEIPINKYSIYEIKSAIDTKIMEVIYIKFIK